MDIITYAAAVAKAKGYVQETLTGEGAVGGKSAYQIAKENGYEGTVEQWLSSLSGSDGATPEIGENGNWWINGADTGVPTNIAIDRISSNQIKSLFKVGV